MQPDPGQVTKSIMAYSPAAWWTRDTALHTYVYCQLLISLPFSVFSTYVTYQLQIVGFMIGNDGQGGPCQAYCIIEWAGSKLDLNAILLYMNAFGIGLGGLVTLFLSAYSDYWCEICLADARLFLIRDTNPAPFTARKHLMVTLLFIIYGVIAIPVYWLQGVTGHNFQVLSALSIAFTIVTSILVAILNIYIPHCMRTVPAGATKPAREGTYTTFEHFIVFL
jgi:hypothetical protein